ncbi:MAG: hypothetical protein JNM45_10355 [Rhizobiales bacterium]|nr:hypothetical protein [Hyphomicrobiales bacterium]
MQDRDLLAIRDAGLISTSQFEEISAFLQGRDKATATGPRFDLTHVLWYAGALIIMGAMGLFTNEAFNSMGGLALAMCGAAYMLAFGIAGHLLWRSKATRTPGGLAIAVAIAMVPLIVYGIQDWLNLWDYAKGDPGQYRNFFPYVHGSWLYMEAATALAALIAVRSYRFPFILMVAAVALWFMSMDLAMWFTRSPDASYTDTFDIRRTVSMWFGLALMIVAWLADLRRKGPEDMTFWLHMAGAAAFWGGLSLSSGAPEFQKFLYCLINVALLGYSLFINRRIYAVFAAFGVALYLGHLAQDVFRDTILFSFALSAIGIAIVAAGLYLHKTRASLERRFADMLPEGLRRFRPGPGT